MVPTAYAAAFPFLGPHPHPNTLSTNDMNGVTSAGPSVLFRGDLGRAFDCDRGLGDPGESHFSAALFVTLPPCLAPWPCAPTLDGVAASLSLAKTSNIPTPVVVFPARAIPSLSQSLRMADRPACAPSSMFFSVSSNRFLCCLRFLDTLSILVSIFAYRSVYA